MTDNDNKWPPIKFGQGDYEKAPDPDGPTAYWILGTLLAMLTLAAVATWMIGE